jgi:copper chaperone CopZ
MNTNKKLLGAGLFSALAASICCITPVLAIIAGTSGIASSFSWMEPARPYFIGMTILVLGYAWYQKMKPLKKDHCDCAADQKTKFIQTKLFLGIVTVLAIIMLSLPSISHVLYTCSKDDNVIKDRTNFQSVEFTIEGMTCESCEDHIDYEVNKLSGIQSVIISYSRGSAIIDFDTSKIEIGAIEKAINGTGYYVINKKKQ